MRLHEHQNSLELIYSNDSLNLESNVCHQNDPIFSAHPAYNLNSSKNTQY